MKAGQRVSYKHRGEIRHGVIIEIVDMMGTAVLMIRADASDVIHGVPQQNIITR